MKLLVSGATGFIGQNLVKKLVHDGHHVTTLIRSTSNRAAVRRLKAKAHMIDADVEKLADFLLRQKFDGVIHLASVFLAQHMPEDIGRMVDANVKFSTQLLEATCLAKIPFFLNTGTFWQHFEDKPFSPVNLYSATKQAFEDISTFYVETGRINFVTLQLSDTFGPGDPRPKIMSLFVRAMRTGQVIDMSPGKQLLDISYIDDVVSAYIRLIQLLHHDKRRRMNGRVFAVKAKRRVTLRQLANIFETVAGRPLPIAWGRRPYRAREVMVPWRRGHVVPGWKPKVSLRQGIQKTLHASI